MPRSARGAHAKSARDGVDRGGCGPAAGGAAGGAAAGQLRLAAAGCLVFSGVDPGGR